METIPTKTFKELLNENATLEIANNTWKQLGGQSRLKIMIGARNFVYDGKDGSVAFKFPRSKGINYIKVSLLNDLYTIEFGNIVKYDYAVVKTVDSVDVSQLKSVIENEIGKTLSL